MPIIPHLTVKDGRRAVEYYKAAFGAEEVRVVPAEDGKRLMHAELKFGDSTLFLCDDFPEYCGGKSRIPDGSGSVTLHLNVSNCDTAVSRAEKAGGKVIMGPEDMFWGDRYAQVLDPFGHTWSFSTPIKK
jgi:PhnB protein